MKNKILILGAADLNDTWMFLDSGWPSEHLIITELRSEKTLTKDYGEAFLENLFYFRNKKIDIQFSCDATQLSKKILKNVKFIFFGSPHFEDKNAHKMLSLFFKSVDAAFRYSSSPAPVIGIALDCLGPDGLYNLNTRFNIFNIPGWSVTHLLDLKGCYNFSPSHPDDNGRKVLSDIISDNILILLFSKLKTLPSFLSTKNMPFFISGEQNKNDAYHYVNLNKIPILSFQDYIEYLKQTPLHTLHKGPTHLSPHFLNKCRKQYMNCFSQPSEKHPLRPTHVMKQEQRIHQKACIWQKLWRSTQGGLFPRRKK